jgi:hypothetical protein
MEIVNTRCVRSEENIAALDDRTRVLQEKVMSFSNTVENTVSTESQGLMSHANQLHDTMQQAVTEATKNNRQLTTECFFTESAVKDIFTVLIDVSLICSNLVEKDNPKVNWPTIFKLLKPYQGFFQERVTSGVVSKWAVTDPKFPGEGTRLGGSLTTSTLVADNKPITISSINEADE